MFDIEPPFFPHSPVVYGWEKFPFGLRTHPCLTPAFTGNPSCFILLPAKTLNYPDQMLGNTMCSKSGPQFRPIDQTGLPTANNLSITSFADTRCSSRRQPQRNPCCSSAWLASNTCSTRASIMQVKTLYKMRTLAIGGESEGNFALLNFANMMNIVLFQVLGTLPVFITTL